MTASTPALSAEGRRYRFSILRILICGILLAVLVAACMYVRHTAFDFYHARLLEDGSKTTAWFVEQVGYALPWILICVFHGIVYVKHDRHDGICRREMFWEVLLVAVLTYGVLLPYMASVSDTMYETALEIGADIPQISLEKRFHDVTLIMKLHEWFIRLSIPLAILLLYHSTRARREIRFPETEAVEPTVTKAEYDALRRAAEAEEEASSAEDALGESTEEEAVPTSAAEAPATSAQEVTDRE